MKTEFRILDITRKASWDDIKRAYRDKMKKCHPDLNSENTQMLNQATLESKEVNAAYSKLKSCLTQTGRFITPSFTFVHKSPQQNSNAKMQQTNVSDFFQPRSDVSEQATQAMSFGSILFNIVLLLLWLGALGAVTIQALKYFNIG